jgi:hypothetical protein
MEIANVEREKAAIVKSNADHLEKDAVRATVEETPHSKYTSGVENTASK